MSAFEGKPDDLEQRKIDIKPLLPGDALPVHAMPALCQ
jgi:hypothetical protein